MLLLLFTLLFTLFFFFLVLVAKDVMVEDPKIKRGRSQGRNTGSQGKGKG